MCTGRIDLSFIIRAFSKGADGVIIGGCWPGECHYVTEGNYDALANVHLAHKLLDHVGIKRERLRLEWVAASEGARFAELMTAFSRQVSTLGPLGQVEGLDESSLKLELAAVTRVIPYLKLVERERLRPPIRTEEGINAFFERDDANRIFDELIADALAASPARAPQVDLARIDQIVDHHRAEASALIQILLEIQAENRWLPEPALERVAARLDVSSARIRHIATFYKAFSLVAKGRHQVHLCVGTACHVRGAARVLDRMQEVTGIGPGETDPELKFSLETVNCLGCCALGPVMDIDGKIHSRLSSAEATRVLKGYE
jgi:NADH:ubiquinone oxidoreductase subunit E/coenzyme F420-reducing hydrogenase delta subunit